MNKHIYFTTLLISLLLVNISLVCGQETKMFLRSGVHSHTASRMQIASRSSVSFEEMKFLNNKNIDPNNNGTINYQLVEKSLEKIFPQKSATGYLCVDLEDINYDILKASYSDMRNMKFTSQQLNLAIKNFAYLAHFIKEKRPNIKIGMYGIPFKIYNENSLRRGAEDLFTPILKEVDILFPSLYLPYLPVQKNDTKIKNFLNRNLSNAFNYGDKLNKQVIPLIWYFTLSTNKLSNNVMIPKSKMEEIINHIKAYRSPRGRQISGIIWWDGAAPFYKRNLHKINQNYIPKADRQQAWNQNKAFEYYLGK